jgi:hypothetical protein
MTPDWTPVTPRTLDPRDYTKDPPAMLDPESVLRNRERVRIYQTTGRWTWPNLKGN